MRAVDFTYDGKKLSEYGFIVCDFDYSNGVVESTSGAVITFNTATRNRGRKYSLTGVKYEECIKTTFDICKDPDKYTYENREITSTEYDEIVRWLCREEFRQFCATPENGERVCYFNASFNITKLKINEVVYGLRLSMETDSPFGYGDEVANILELAKDGTATINDTSKIVGTIYPNVKITCNEGGDLNIENATFGGGKKLVIANCESKETITLSGDTLTISTNSETHDICNDFNYVFLPLGNSLTERKNTISSNLSCTIEISYTPIIKDVP